MKRFTGLLLLTGMLLIPAFGKKASSPFEGRWDITVTTPESTNPGWMELIVSGGVPQVRVQPRGGSVYAIKSVKQAGKKLILILEPGSAGRPANTWELTSSNGRLSGVLKSGGTVKGQVAGLRAPALKRSMPQAWTVPEPIFNGKDLTGWEPDNPAHNAWVAKGGMLINEKSGANLKSTRKFDDFKLHIEYNCPKGGNSGIYLRGRYEIQVEYELTPEDTLHEMGAIYGFVAPKVQLPPKPGEWESFDVTLVGRWLTIVRNGVTTIDNQEIAGITGGALDSHEAEPGPLYIQGDHTGDMKFRNIMVSVPKK
jgi:hypothetical protein